MLKSFSNRKKRVNRINVAKRHWGGEVELSHLKFDSKKSVIFSWSKGGLLLLLWTATTALHTGGWGGLVVCFHSSCVWLWQFLKSDHWCAFLPSFHPVTLQANLAALRLHFPDWIFRLYVDHKSLDASTMDQLIDLGRDPAFDLCIGLEHQGLKLNGRNGMLWRFLPLLDNLVDVRKQLSGKILWRSFKVVLVRDLDSRLSGREAAAVHEWLNDTRFPVHVMRCLAFEPQIYVCESVLRSFRLLLFASDTSNTVWLYFIVYLHSGTIHLIVGQCLEECGAPDLTIQAQNNQSNQGKAQSQENNQNQKKPGHAAY